MFRTLRKAAESFDAAFSTGTDKGEGRVIHVDGLSLRLGKVFAEGGFSFVHSAEPVAGPPHVRYAVKRIAVAESESLHRAKREADLLANLPSHPNIVKYFGSLFSPPDAFLVFEMLDGGSLAERLNSRKVSLKPEEALDILADVAGAITHLHAQSPEPIACRDLKLENVLYDRLETRYKLCDFGSCSTTAKSYDNRRDILDAEDEIKEHCSAPYRSPELVDLYSKQFVCEKSDVWSMGCVWFAVLYGKLPFDGQSTLSIQQARYSIPDEPTYPEAFRKLVAAMLTSSVSRRPDSFTVLEAVCRLQGREIDQNLRETGVRLRQKRQRHLDSSSGESCGTLNQPSRPKDEVIFEPHGHQTEDLMRWDFTEDTPTDRSGTGDRKRQGAAGAVCCPASPVVASANIIAVHESNGEKGFSGVTGRSDAALEGGWADFESAFSEQTNLSDAFDRDVAPKTCLSDIFSAGGHPRSGKDLPGHTPLSSNLDVRSAPNRGDGPVTAKASVVSSKTCEFADLLPPGFGK